MSSDGDKIKVLIVEDEALVAMMIEDVVTDLGYEVAATVGRLAPALEEAEKVAADVAVIDVNLNGERTYPIAEVLQRRGIPFMFATGYGIAGVDEQWRSAPVLQKPFQPHELGAALNSLIRKPAQG